MKICFISGIYPHSIGGAEYQAKILAEEISKYHEVFFITISGSKEGITNIGNIRIYELLIDGKWDRKFLYFSVFRKMKKIIGHEKPDRIYQRVLTPYTIWLAKFARKIKTPFILHIASEHSIKFNRSLISRIRRLLFFKILSYRVYLIVQTINQKEILKDIIDYPTFLFPNVMHDVVSKDNCKSEKIVLWIGKATPVKQMELFLDLADYFKDEKMTFVIISKFFDDELSHHLLNRIFEINNVLNLGMQNNKFINQYLEEKAYLLVNTSISEGFSNTFIQAWMRGVPVISFNSNPNNLLTKFNIGTFCNADTHHLRKAVSNYITNQELYRTAVSESKKIAAAKFSAKINIPKFIQYIEEANFNV